MYCEIQKTTKDMYCEKDSSNEVDNNAVTANSTVRNNTSSKRTNLDLMSNKQSQKKKKREQPIEYRQYYDRFTDLDIPVQRSTCKYEPYY